MIYRPYLMKCAVEYITLWFSSMLIPDHLRQDPLFHVFVRVRDLFNQLTYKISHILSTLRRMMCRLQLVITAHNNIKHPSSAVMVDIVHNSSSRTYIHWRHGNPLFLSKTVIRQFSVALHILPTCTLDIQLLPCFYFIIRFSKCIE